MGGRTIPRPAAIAALGVLAFAAAGRAEADCKFQKLADVPVTMEGLRPSIMTQVNGRDAKFTIDTGAFFGAVTPEAVTKYGMKHAIPPFGMQVKGLGRTERAISAAAVDSITFAGIGFKGTEFMVISRTGGGEIAGAIGENLLGPFDVEYDFANGMIRYFRAQGCSYDTNLAYWSKGQTVSRLDLVNPTNIITAVIANAKIDGHKIQVDLDSGAGLSILSRQAAARAGIKVNSAGVVSAGVTYGIYGAGIETFLAPFSSFAIGDEEIKNTQLRIGDLDLGETDMLLGADFFLSHRILVSSSQKRIYFTYNGGPVFRLDGQAPAVAQSGAPAPRPEGGAAATGVAAAAAGQEPQTGAEFARRAAAEAARREFATAIADYTRAIELEPDVSKHYRARGMVRLAARQPVLAMADLDESLKRDPKDPEALMRRGELYLAARDPGRAKTDFEAAKTLSSDQSSVAIQAGYAYARYGEYEAAIGELDAWVAAHPKHDDLPQVLAVRCFARAGWGKQLELGLADCDTALKSDNNSSGMESRGLILLRLGRLDEAITQFAAAIKAQPRSAAAFYGRGLAELKKGSKAAGEADIAAAKAITPAIADQFKRMGVAPDDAGAAKS